MTDSTPKARSAVGLLYYSLVAELLGFATASDQQCIDVPWSWLYEAFGYLVYV